MKKLLTVAINSYNTAPLRGCINDSNNIKEAFTKQGYDIVQLVEGDATKQNIVTSLTNIGRELKSGDKFVFIILDMVHRFLPMMLLKKMD